MKKLVELHFEIETPGEWLAPEMLKASFDANFALAPGEKGCEVTRTPLEGGRYRFTFDIIVQNDGTLTEDRALYEMSKFDNEKLRAAGVKYLGGSYKEVEVG